MPSRGGKIKASYFHHKADYCTRLLYDSEINFEISCLRDGGFTWKLGDYANGYVAEGNTTTWTKR
jgi:hypothetical protein